MCRQEELPPSQFSSEAPLPLLNRSWFFSSLLDNIDDEESLRQVGNTRLDAIGQ